MVRHWLGKISLKSFQREAVAAYVFGLACAMGSVLCYAMYKEDMQAFGKSKATLAESQARGITYHHVSVCLLFVAAKSMLFAFWIVFTASTRTFRHRRGADRPRALTPTQPKDRAPHSQNRGWSWVVDEDMVHEATWYLGDIERVGVRDDHMAASYGSPGSLDSGAEGYIDQKEYLTVYWVRTLMCWKSKRVRNYADYADIPDAYHTDTESRCCEFYCCCCAGTDGSLCCQGKELSSSNRRSCPQTQSDSDGDIGPSPVSETTPMLNRR